MLSIPLLPHHQRQQRNHRQQHRPGNPVNIPHAIGRPVGKKQRHIHNPGRPQPRFPVQPVQKDKKQCRKYQHIKAGHHVLRNGIRKLRIVIHQLIHHRKQHACKADLLLILHHHAIVIPDPVDPGVNDLLYDPLLGIQLPLRPHGIILLQSPAVAEKMLRKKQKRSTGQNSQQHTLYSFFYPHTLIPALSLHSQSAKRVCCKIRQQTLPGFSIMRITGLEPARSPTGT